jgi:hypothetical protein
MAGNPINGEPSPQHAAGKPGTGSPEGQASEEQRAGASPYRIPGRTSSSRGSRSSESGSLLGFALLIVILLAFMLMRRGVFR